MNLKLWHDDIRKPPDDTWTWARTNKEAEQILIFARVNGYEVTECSLDHDLGLHNLDPDVPDADMQKGWDEENNGMDFVEWMIEEKIVPNKVTIHSWAGESADNMGHRLLKAIQHKEIDECEVIIKPFRRAICPQCSENADGNGWCETCKDYTCLT